MNLKSRALMLAFVAGLCACKGSSSGSFDLYSGADFSLGSGGDGGTMVIVQDTSAPQVTIISPTANAVITDPRVNVVAKVTVNPGAASLLTVQARIPGQTVPTVLTLQSGSTYAGTVSFLGLPTGSVIVTVDGININNGKNSPTVTVNYDAGPLITVIQPSGTAYARSAPVLVKAQSLAMFGKTGLQALTASVEDLPVVLTLSKSDAFDWVGSGTINFHDPSLLKPLAGVQALHVVATDNNGATSTFDETFTVDEQGPEISAITPPFDTVVGGVVNISATITDPSGVDDSSVQAVWLNSSTYTVPLTHAAGSSVYTGRFDTNRLPDPTILVLPAMSIQAADRLGNGSNAAGEYILDNTPPVMSLTPPNSQVRLTVPPVAPVTTGFQCSVSFSPIGSDPDLVADKQVTNQVVTVRARVTDLPNDAEGLESPTPAGIDPNTVELLAVPLALDGSSPPLLVDTDGKGTCNNLNPTLQPASAITGSNQAFVIQLVNIISTGAPVYSGPLAAPFVGNGQPLYCNQNTAILAGAANPLCSALLGSDPTFSYALPGEIWTIGPLQPCAGLQLDTLDVVPRGPFCMAVRAADKSGNRSVSLPIRVCIENPLGNDPNQPCAAFKQAVKIPDGTAGSLPSCLGKYDPTTASIVAGMQCTPATTTPYPLPSEPYIISM